MSFFADSVIPYRIKKEVFSKNQTTISYYGGSDSITAKKPIMMSVSENQCYHKLVSDTTSRDGLEIVTRNYLDTLGNPSSSCESNREIMYYNNRLEVLYHYVYKDSTLLYAHHFEYDDGQIVSQSVVGVDDTPIRCAKWDDNNLCYYKMKLIYNLSKTLVAIKGINEFGEESLITLRNYEFNRSILPLDTMKVITSNKESLTKSLVYGIKIYRESARIVNKNNTVEYIHIIDKTGTWYKAGIRDGDLLVSSGNITTVARPNPKMNNYKIMKLTTPDGNSGAEHYTVFFTESEMKRYINSIKNRI